MKGYPFWFSARFICFFIGLFFVSGLLLIPSQLEFRLQWNELNRWSLEGNYKTLAVALHVAMGFMMMFIIGALWPIHMRSLWRHTKHRISGVSMVAIWFMLLFTGIGLLYWGQEFWLTISSMAHTILGLVVVFIFIWHTKFHCNL